MIKHIINGQQVESSKTFQTINPATGEVIAEVASGGEAEINAAVNHMDQAVQQNAAMVEQTAAATHSVRDEAAELVRLVSRFQVNPADSGRRRERPGGVAIAALRGGRA